MAKEGVIEIIVYSEGTKVADLFELSSLWTKVEVDGIGVAILTFPAGDIAKQKVEESEKNTFDLGKEIKIEAVVGTTEKTVLFEGLVTRHSFDFIDGDGRLVVECKTFTYLLTLNVQSKSFYKKSIKDILSAVFSPYSKITSKIDNISFKHNEVIQFYQSDWDFVLNRMQDNGLVLITDGKDVTIGKPKFKKSSLHELVLGNNVLEVRLEQNSEQQFGAIKASTWDITKQKVITENSTPYTTPIAGTHTSKQISQKFSNPELQYRRSTVQDKQLLKDWLEMQSLVAELSKMTGTVKIEGTTKAKLGEVIKLKGVSTRFEGDYFVGGIEHEFEDGIWNTTLSLGYSPKDAISSSTSSNFAGLHIGKVKKIIEDPCEHDRVLVDLPLLGAEKNEVWARLGTISASNSYGFLIVPDIGDEVIVGFFSEYGNDAVILGSLYNTKNKMPGKVEAENYRKGFFTKEKLSIEFNDEEKSISLSIKDGGKVAINDKDKLITIKDVNENTISLTEKSLTIESKGDLIFKAEGLISFESGKDIDAKSGKDFKVKGTNIKMTADSVMEVKGGSKAELSASGNAVVKGALVKIN